MSLPQTDPSLPSATSPLFSDTDAARGDHMRANNQAIWENLQYLFNFTGRTTDTLTEGAANLYYTDVRAKAAAIAAALTGLAAGSDAAIAATDTILQAFAKTQGQITADKAAIAALAAKITSPATCTPSIDGLGTTSGINVYSHREGAYLVMAGRLTVGTPAASEIRVNLCSAGGDGNVTSASNYGALEICGVGVASANAGTYFPLIEAGKTYFTVGYTAGGQNGLVKQNGSDIFSTGSVFSFNAKIRIQGW